MWGWVISKQARHERVSRKMIRAMEKQMYATVSDSRDEEFATSAGWINLILCRNNFTCRRMPESSESYEELNACPKLLPGPK